MTTEEWLEKEGYPITMPMTRSNLANIIDRYVMQVASKNFIKPDVMRCKNCGNEIKNGRESFCCDECKKEYIS